MDSLIVKINYAINSRKLKKLNQLLEISNNFFDKIYINLL